MIAWLAALMPCGHDVGVRAGPDPRYEGACELWWPFQAEAAAAERFPVAGALQVDVDQACRVGAGDDVFDVSGPFGAQLRGWLAQQQPVAVPWPVLQLEPHDDRPVRQFREETIPAGPGSYVLVPRGTRHTISAGAGGGRLLVLMVPGNDWHKMFFELANLPPRSITDPTVRAAISAKYDSIPA